MVRRSGSLGVLLAILAVLVFQISPALAHHKDGHAQGGGKGKQAAARDDGARGGSSGKDGSTSTGREWTEDNDTNDNDTPNNVPDGGDNKHPSGKDRSVEPGGSGNQGNSTSDPDDDGRGPDRSNGGPDKPNGSGGDDLADQDGNNGCGNDDDFEDDNEGWCGKPPKDDDDEVLGSDQKTCPEVMGSREACEDADVAADDVAPAGDEVKGVQHFAVPAVRAATTAVAGAAPAVAAAGAAAGGVLPFTGAALIPFAALGMLLIAIGGALIARKH